MMTSYLVTFSEGKPVTLAELERRQVIGVMELFDGNKTKAAKFLGITIKTLYNKLHEYGEFERFRKFASSEFVALPTKE